MPGLACDTRLLLKVSAYVSNLSRSADHVHKIWSPPFPFQMDVKSRNTSHKQKAQKFFTIFLMFSKLNLRFSLILIHHISTYVKKHHLITDSLPGQGSH